ncbi:UNVERIFIED_CONTAM: aspartyl-phosphate phosphatase Spo0E family protein [Halobacillus marinus]|uniref:aspartyl-phosphate phosphatase Spo0E family protein n=1 Tax=Halobacillus sp. BAB-2008 TaxID=1246484 RepID=UPI0002A4D4C5|nr:aspartyl-phosphate phosphatase Spo0E family protein [Halobacillus sp. BAB-2008]ELK44151.1 hypothetical protein D479_20223 [Halobacillus sp. BAB-2008]
MCSCIFLKKRIERKRQKMYNAYLNKADYDYVVSISQELDNILTLYQRHSIKKGLVVGEYSLIFRDKGQMNVYLIDLMEILVEVGSPTPIKCFDCN